MRPIAESTVATKFFHVYRWLDMMFSYRLSPFDIQAIERIGLENQPANNGNRRAWASIRRAFIKVAIQHGGDSFSVP